MPIISEGGRVCGSIRYRTEGHPSNSMVCHCRTCRRVAASPVVAWITFPKDRFAMIKGMPSQFQSSELVLRTFCPSCGTQLTYEHQNHTSSIDITTCSLDNSNAFPPTHHSWLSHDLDWVHFGDGLPTFAEWRP